MIHCTTVQQSTVKHQDGSGLRFKIDWLGHRAIQRIRTTRSVWLMRTRNEKSSAIDFIDVLQHIHRVH